MASALQKSHGWHFQVLLMLILLLVQLALGRHYDDDVKTQVVSKITIIIIPCIICNYDNSV